MNDDLWQDIQLDDEKRGWHDTPPPEINAAAEFVGYAPCPDCEPLAEQGLQCFSCYGSGLVEVWTDYDYLRSN